MAPFMGPSRETLLKLLGAGRPELPITLGHYAPQAVVDCEDGVWRLRALESDRAAEQRAHEEAMKNGTGWMPEHTFQFLRPGKVVLEAASKEAFVAAVRKMRWKWGDGPVG